MKEKVVVLSLGGSLIVPHEVNLSFLSKFRELIKKHSRTQRFVIVCGGGSVARTYIRALARDKASIKFQSYSGISATRMNARFMNYFFGIDVLGELPCSLAEVKGLLTKRRVVFCGGLEYKPHQTSDSTAARIAVSLRADFVNLTNVKGVYTKDPKKYADARFVSHMSWKEFATLASKVAYKPGQHFVLDYEAAKTIHKHKVRTMIVGSTIANLDRLLNGKSFAGTTIFG